MSRPCNGNGSQECAETLQGSTSHAGDTRKASLLVHKMQSGGKVPPMEKSSSSCYRCVHPAHKAAQCPYKKLSVMLIVRLATWRRYAAKLLKVARARARQVKVKREPHLTCTSPCTASCRVLDWEAMLVLSLLRWQCCWMGIRTTWRLILELQRQLCPNPLTVRQHAFSGGLWL